MTTPTLFIRPGGYSAKTTRRVGAPNNHLYGSGENLMVGTNPQEHLWAEMAERLFGPGQDPAAGRAALWDLLKAQTREVIRLRWESTALAELMWELAASKAQQANAHAATVATVSAERDAYLRANNHLIEACASLTEQVAQLRAARDEIARESALREQEVIALTVERDRVLDRLAELETQRSTQDTDDGEVTR